MGRSIREPRVDLDVRAQVASHGTHRPVRMVVHDTESCRLSEPARDQDPTALAQFGGIARYWHGNGYGAHIIVGPKPTILGGLGSGVTARAVDDTEIAWGVENHNTGTLHIELEGNAGWTKAHWMLRQTQLHKAARWMCWWNERWSIPLAFGVDIGVSGHADQTRKYGGSHYDPGSAFPLSYLIWLANWYRKNGGWS